MTFAPREASIQPKLKHVVVLLTPPLLLNNAIFAAKVEPPSDPDVRWESRSTGAEVSAFSP